MADAPRVPFFCPAGAAFGVDLGACLQRVVDSGWYVLGPQVRDFEAAFARHVGVRHALGVANGTDALTLALRALGVQPGQPVVTVANAGCYASTALAQLGAQPLYVDVEPASLTMAPAALAAALAAHPVAAVIVTHLYGQMADMPRLAALCHAAKVPLIEDCAQAHGATLKDRQAGAWGALACFSFYPTKNMHSLEGGMVSTNDAEFARQSLGGHIERVDVVVDEMEEVSHLFVRRRLRPGGAATQRVVEARQLLGIAAIGLVRRDQRTGKARRILRHQLQLLQVGRIILEDRIGQRL